MAEESQGQEYKNIQRTVDAYKTANRINAQQKETRKKINSSVSSYSDNLDQKESKYKEKFNSFITSGKTTVKKYQQLPKNQLSSLIDLAVGSLNRPTNNDSIREIRGIFIRTINNTKEKVKQLLQEEVISTLGCSQEQQYTPTIIYIPVQSIDIFGKTLQYDPNEKPGVYLYESTEFSPNRIPYSFNRELYHRIQNKGVSYFQEYNTYFKGRTEQNLFNITYVTNDGVKDGDFYKVEFTERLTGTKVVDFIGEYYSSIDVINVKDVFTNVMDLLTGAVSIQKNFIDNDKRKQTKLELIIQRILGMCFDNKQEIDVSGVGKLDAQDQSDDNFLILTETEELIIDEKVKNFMSGVIEFVGCEGIKLPVNNDLITNLLDPFNNNNLVTSDPTFLAENMIDSLINNPEWKAKIPNGLDIAINKEFLRVAIIAVTNTILSPKHLFPLVVMEKYLSNNGISPEDLDDFTKKYKKLLMNLVSKISALFIKELLIEIKKNYKTIVQDLLNSQLQEIRIKKKKSIATIITAINIGLTLAAAVEDYRRCQNVIDELKRLLSLAQRLIVLNGTTNPLWNSLSSYKPGMSATSLLTRYIEELDQNGMDTGDLPDGSPNVALINKKSDYQSQMDELAENGKVSVAINSIDVYGLTSGGAPIINLFGNLE